MHTADLCHGTQAMDNSRICHRLMFHEHGKQYFVQPFLRSMKLLRLHTRFNTEVMSWISHAYECRSCMDLPEANSTTVRNLYCLWAACPCLSWSTVAMRALTWVIFIPQASCWCCAPVVGLRRRGSTLGLLHARNYPRTFGLHKIFKYAHLKFTVYGRKHTYTQLPPMQSR